MTSIGFTQSLGYIRIGWQLMHTPGLRRFIWMPLLINLLVFGVLGYWLISWASNWLDSWSVFENLADVWIVQALETLLRWLLALVLLFSMGYLFTLLANLIGAPFNGLLAERVEAHLTGQLSSPAPGWLQVLKSVPRLMGSELAKLIYLFVFLLPLLILQFIPVLNLIAPVLLFMFGAWMFALEYLDYPMGNHGALFRDVRKLLRSRRRIAFGFGTGVALLSTVPIVNLFIMPVAVAGATALYVDHLKDLHRPEGAD